MKELFNYSGGRGIYIDDFQVLQEQTNYIKEHLFRGHGAFVISGCAHGVSTIDPGLVMIDNKMIKTPQFDVSSYPVYMYRLTPEESDPRFYDRDAANKNAFLTEKADIFTQPVLSEYIKFEATKTPRNLKGLINEFVRVDTNQWTNLSLINGWTSIENKRLPQIMKDPSGFVHLRGNINGFSSTDPVFASIPSDMRTLNAQNFHTQLVVDRDTTQSTAEELRLYMLGVDIGSSGFVRCERQNGTKPKAINLGGVSWYVGY